MSCTLMSGRPALASHSLIAVLLAALQDAGRLDDIPERLLRRRLESALTVGNPDGSYVLPILERADAFLRHVQDRTHKAYVGAGAEPIRIDYPSLRDAVATPPAYLNDYLDLVERLRANPQVARELLQVAELTCFDALLGDSAWKAKSFAHLFTMEHKGLLLVGLRCLSRIAGAQVASALRGLHDLPFEASSGLVPDRGEPAGQDTLFDPDGSSGRAEV
ncbi:hypothetical protein [Streptomyces gobiensis]|uniref:hypothetical protein n=1 Tax=Streptomyces gobiensis TaxID=2875706 RepID=UPI001E461B24|nr:hypothetical protein [Streptomyces gobiensis]UGY91101.1 hypothetical protein test1122_04760 [Streptomyces gobiensis]